MGKYINKRQLVFLVLVIGAIYLVRLTRSDGNDQGNKAESIKSSLEEDYRNEAHRLTDRATCQRSCLGVSDSSLLVIIRYGTVTNNGDTLKVEGKTLNGKLLKVSFLRKQDFNLITNLHVRNHPPCECNHQI